MKALSILQPWASLVVIGLKHIETRPRNTKYRGPLLIHSSKRLTTENIRLGQAFNMNHGAGLGFIDDLPLGQIIGKVDLIGTFPTDLVWSGSGGIGFKCNLRVKDGDVLKMVQITKAEEAFGDYSPGRYGWLLSNPVLFKAGIPINGQLGLWEYNGPLPE